MFTAFYQCPFLQAAHKLNIVQVRVVKLHGDVVWVTVAYVAHVHKLQEPASDGRTRLRQCRVLQQTLYAAFREFIGFRHSGIRVRMGRRILRVFTHVLMYLADLPQERAVLFLTSGQCAQPCSTCAVSHADHGTALTARRPHCCGLARQSSRGGLEPLPEAAQEAASLA